MSAELLSQNSTILKRLDGELNMTFPSIYFTHNSLNYASMPYSADSCFKFIALHFDNTINSLVIWRDSSETEDLTNRRIKKIKAGLSKYGSARNITIHSMGNAQKISRHTIAMTSDSSEIKYLLSLNSVFDISGSRLTEKTSGIKPHILHPKIWCLNCWKNGFHLNKSARELRKMNRRQKKERKT